MLICINRSHGLLKVNYDVVSLTDFTTADEFLSEHICCLFSLTAPESTFISQSSASRVCFRYDFDCLLSNRQHDAFVERASRGQSGRPFANTSVQRLRWCWTLCWTEAQSVQRCVSRDTESSVTNSVQTVKKFNERFDSVVVYCLTAVEIWRTPRL